MLFRSAGFWMAYRLEEPGSSGVLSFRRLLLAARPWWPKLRESGEIILRFDGEFGNTGGFRVCRDEAVHAIGRMSRYALLQRPEIQAAVESASWHKVYGSDTAKPTEAADLGWVTLYPSEGSVDADKGPVEVRVILSRLRPTDGKAKHGVMIDGYQVEMFGTTLLPDAWPAEEIVSLYRGRAVIENRFAQEDREFATERTFSYHVWAQMLMVSVAMFLWNRLICATPPALSERPQQELRPPDVPAPPLVFPSVEESKPTVEASPPTTVVEPTIPAALTNPEPPNAAPSSASLTAPPDSKLNPGFLASLVVTWFSDIPTQPGWSLDPQQGTITCPRQTTFRPSCTDESKKNYHRIIVTNRQGDCDGCPFRIECFGSTRPNIPKRIARSVPKEVAEKAREALRLQRPRVAARPTSRVIPKAPLQERQPLSLHRPQPEHTPGPWQASAPSFLPAAARKKARRALEGRATLRIRRCVSVPKLDPFVEESRAVRQHQRRKRGVAGHYQVTLRVIADHAGPTTRWMCN